VRAQVVDSFAKARMHLRIMRDRVLRRQPSQPPSLEWSILGLSQEATMQITVTEAKARLTDLVRRVEQEKKSS
jgi:hypothetical protein